MSKFEFLQPWKSVTVTGAALAALLAVSACQTIGTNAQAPVAADSEAGQLAAIQDVFNASADQVPTLTAVGYAVVSSQPGRTDAQKRLMAIRSARMAAMRDLAEQIHGLQVDSSTTVIDLMCRMTRSAVLFRAQSGAPVPCASIQPDRTPMKSSSRLIGK